LAAFDCWSIVIPGVFVYIWATMPARFHYLTLAAFGFAFLSSLGYAQETKTNAAPIMGEPTGPANAAHQTIAEAVKDMNANNMDGALSKLTEAIQLNPHNPTPYVLRASLYCQKKLWSQAEADFKAAQQLAPTNSVIKVQLIEVKFMQKEYDVARPGYVALEKDPDLGDFASYKVFLCDLAGGHEDVAKKDLDAFDQVDGNPSYYFGNAAWSIVHKNFDDARKWLESASRIYPARKNAYYAESLIYLGYLPLPKSATASSTDAPAAN
jgi:tetratricopeptide (TPR) repeat protein